MSDNFCFSHTVGYMFQGGTNLEPIMRSLLYTLIIQVFLTSFIYGFDECPFKCSCVGTTVTCNELQENLPQSFPSQTTRLHISNSYINNIKSESLRIMGNLQNLVLEAVDITFIHSCAFANLPKLQEIKIIDSSVYSIVRNGFSYLKNVKQIIIQKSNITSFSQFAFNDIEGLDLLNISGVRLDTVESSAFTNLSSVRNLILENNIVKVIKPRPFQNLQNISNFVISKNVFHSKICGMFGVISHKTIGHLEFVGNRLECDCGILVLNKMPSEFATVSDNRCTKPASVKGMLLSDVTKGTLCNITETNACNILPIKPVHNCNTYTYDEPIQPRDEVKYPDDNDDKSSAPCFESINTATHAVLIILMYTIII